LQNAKFGGLKAGRQQARAYYDAHLAAFHQVASVHLWSIQVSAERIAESALARLRSGRPFQEVARQFSNDLEAKAKGGDLGRVLMASLPVPFRKVIAATRPGHVSKPVAGPGGWFLLLAKGVRSDSTTPFAQAEPPLVRELTRRKRFAAVEAWLNAAREKATVTRP
jgi:parvulin-like peptidyl-prolyl isomerase